MAKNIDLGDINKKTKNTDQSSRSRVLTKHVPANTKSRSENLAKAPGLIKFGTKRKLRFRRIFLTCFGVIVVALLILYFFFGASLAAAFKAFNIDPLSFVVNQVTGKKSILDSTNGKTTFLILGVDNRAQDLSFDLKRVGNTDSIMLIVLDNQTQKVNIISIPRDIGVQFNLPNGPQFAKVNSAVNIGANSNYSGGGIQLMMDTV
jgi:anionic cell wall polymer biosynthesis LytR-Cps2A-Psr (LCP) family protein